MCRLLGSLLVSAAAGTAAKRGRGRLRHNVGRASSPVRLPKTALKLAKLHGYEGPQDLQVGNVHWSLDHDLGAPAPRRRLGDPHAIVIRSRENSCWPNAISVKNSY